MGFVSPTTAFQFLAVFAANIGALSLLPATQAFSRPFPTFACLGLFGIHLWFLARLVAQGNDLSLLIPLLSALIPLTMIGVGIAAYGEDATPIRIGLLVLACCCAGAAAAITR